MSRRRADRTTRAQLRESGWVRVVKRSLLSGRGVTSASDFEAGSRLSDIVASAAADLDDEARSGLRVVLHGEYESHVVPAENWAKTRVGAGALVVVTDPPLGGSTLKSILSIVVAVVALAVAGPLAGALGLTAIFGATAATALVGAGLAFAGNFLLNLLIPPPDSDSGRQSPIYTLEGFKNNNQVNQPVPMPIGLRHRFAPPYAVLPYISIRNDKIYLTAVFLYGYAPMLVDNMRIGDRGIDRFDSDYVKIEHRGVLKDDGSTDNSPFTLVRETVVQKPYAIRLTYYDDGVDDGEVGKRTEPTIVETEPDTLRYKILLSFPEGLYNVKGKKKKRVEKAVVVRIEIRLLAPAGEPEAAWTLVEDWFFEDKITKAFYKEIEHTVPGSVRGIYEIRLSRQTGDPPSDEAAAIELFGLQSILPEYPINQPTDTPFAMTAVEILATNQLKGTLDEWNADVATLIDAWNHVSESFDPLTETGNPADWYRHLLTMPQNVKPIPAEFLYDEEIENWHNFCRINDLMFSRIYDYENSADATIREVCAVGRAAPRPHGGLRGVSIDRPKDPDTAYPLTPYNIWEFEGQRAYKQSDVHGFRIKFKDRTNRFITAVREVVRPDLPPGVEPVNFEQHEPPGLTDPEQVYIWGYKLWLEIIHRPDTLSGTMDIESRILEHGDLVSMSHRTLHNSHESGIVLSVDGRLVVITEPVFMESGKIYAVRFRRVIEMPDGTANIVTTLRSVVTVPGKTQSLVMVGTGQMPEEGDLVWFGEATVSDFDGVVQSVEPSDNFTGHVSVVAQAQIIFDTLDTLVVPPWSSRVGSVLPGSTDVPPAPVVSRVVSSSTLYEEGETMPNSPRRVRVYAEESLGQPRTAEFKVRARVVGAPSWQESPWFGVATPSYVYTTQFSVGDSIEAQAKSRTRYAVESATWSDSELHTVGEEDPEDPVVSDVTVASMGSGAYRVSFSVDQPEFEVLIFQGPSSSVDLTTMTQIHTGAVVSSPYVAYLTLTAGTSYKFAVVPLNDDGEQGVPVFYTLAVGANPAPPTPTDHTAILTTDTVATAATASDADDVTFRLQFRQGRPGGTFAAATTIKTLRADPGVRRTTSVVVPVGAHTFWATAVSEQSVQSVTPAGPIAIVRTGESFADDYNRADSSTIGASYTEAGGTAVFGISGNRMLLTPGTGRLCTTPNAYHPNHYVECDWYSLDATTSYLVVRAVDTGNWLGVRKVNNNWQIAKRVGGAAVTQIGSNVAATIAAGDKLRLEISGQTLTLYHKGVSVGTFSVPSGELTSGTLAGFYGLNAALNVDNLRVGVLA